MGSIITKAKRTPVSELIQFHPQPDIRLHISLIDIIMLHPGNVDAVGFYLFREDREPEDSGKLPIFKLPVDLIQDILHIPDKDHIAHRAEYPDFRLTRVVIVLLHVLIFFRIIYSRLYKFIHIYLQKASLPAASPGIILPPLIVRLLPSCTGRVL